MEEFLSNIKSYINNKIDSNDGISAKAKEEYLRILKPYTSPKKKNKNPYQMFLSDNDVKNELISQGIHSKDINKKMREKWHKDMKRYHSTGSRRDKNGRFDYTEKAKKYVGEKEFIKKQVSPRKRFKTVYRYFYEDYIYNTKLLDEYTAALRSSSKCKKDKYTKRELIKEIWNNEMKNYNPRGTKKDKNGRFDYTEKAKKYVDLSIEDQKEWLISNKILKSNEESGCTSELPGFIITGLVKKQLNIMKCINDNDSKNKVDFIEYYNSL
jgi:hypothetical protein